MTSVRRPAVIALIVLLLVACGDDGTKGQTGAASSTVASTTSTTAAGEPVEPFEGATTPTSIPFTGREAPALLTDVRVAAHEGFERVVFEFEGDLTPGVDARYVEPPVQEDASGRPVTVAGHAFLQVRMEPASGVDLRGDQPVETYTGPKRIEADGPALTEVVHTGDFEANLTWVLGLDEKVAFRVFTLSNPARVVVDVESG